MNSHLLWEAGFARYALEPRYGRLGFYLIRDFPQSSIYSVSRLVGKKLRKKMHVAAT